MKIGLKAGMEGTNVERLHGILVSAGHEIARDEIERHKFGPSTLAALQAFQSGHGLRRTKQINRATLEVLLELEQNITVNINEAATRQPEPKPDQHRGVVRGKLVDEDGAPIANARISLFAKSLRTEKNLGNAKTNKQGQYTITYRRASALNLFARAYDGSGKVMAESVTVFTAAAGVGIDFTTANDGVVRSPSRFTAIETKLTEQLHGTSLESLTENKDTHDLKFLASAIGVPFDDVAYLYIAYALGTKDQIRDATFFGIFYQGVPASLDAALASLPDAGIDNAFTSQVLNGVLAHSRGSLSETLTSAVDANVLPASYLATLDSELTLLDTLRAQSTGSTPYIRGKTSLNDLLAGGGVADVVKSAFTQAYADNAGQLGPTWKTLRANKNLSAADLATLNTTLSVGELLTGNLPLIKDTLNRLMQKTLAKVQDLALLDQNDWMARITDIDPGATSIPQVLPGDTPQQRIARFSKALAARFASRYPTTAFAGGLSKAAASSFPKTKGELVNFLITSPKFSFKNTNLDHFIVANKAAISAPALADLKKAQRLFRVSPHYATVDALNSAGHQSAQSVYFKGRDLFLAEMTPAFGSASLAKMAYARAHMIYASSLMAFLRYNASLNGIGVAALGPSQPDPSTLANLPDLQALFGSLDYFQCEDCQSVYSPAAYLVDLLQYLSGFKASGGGVSDARDALFLRRPEIQYVALDCKNTNVTLPYIDLVNEIFETAIAPPATPVTLIDTIGTSEERRALPQNLSQAAYTKTASVVFPLTLPFDLAFAQTAAYIGGLGTTRTAILTLFARSAAGPGAAAIAGASLGINPEMQLVINGTDPYQDWERWGLAKNPASVIDPETGQPYVPTPADWVAALSKVPVLMNRSGLSLQQLYQLLEVVWVTQSGVTLQLGTTTSGGVQILSSDTDLMVFSGLTADVLDRANRFLRLWTASDLKMWELDWALEAAPGGLLNDTFLVFLSGALAVRTQLKLPFQEVLSFWMPIETRDVTSHLGDEDTVVPATYSEVFRNAAVLASCSSVFVPVNQSTITGASNASPIAITTAGPHGYQTGMQVTIAGALGNTAANGTFTITVTSPTSFTLNGSNGNGAWTSGGITTGILSGNTIIPAPSAPPTPEQNAITASLALSADDISTILAFTGASNTLTLATLNVLLQYQRLSLALSLGISDLMKWIQLTAGKPFGGAAADTTEFCRRLAVLQGTGIAVHDLDYLLREQSASQSSIAFTATQATTVLQTIRDAIAKLPSATTLPITGASNAAPIAVSTAVPNGLQTGAQVSISGALGNTAANGTFTITVTSPTSFSLNGSAGNGLWTSGGIIAVTPYDTTTIQTIFVTALAAATGTTANVVTPVLLKTGVLPLSSNTIALLVAQTSGIDPTQFPNLINAFTTVAKAAALFTALKATETEFTFVVQNANTFNWLDPSALPLSPTNASPYAPFEALLRALKLDQRQAARTPKLFDILSQWLPPNALPPDLPTAIGGPPINVIGASNTSPIAITTSAPHGLQTGMEVTISGAVGNTAANGSFTITVTGASSFSLNGSAGNGVWTAGGTVAAGGIPCLALALNASVNDVLAIAQALGATSPNLTPANLPGSLADMAMLASIASALDVVVRYGISGTTLVELSTVPANTNTASAAMGALQAQYTQSVWFRAIQPVEDALRQSRRDALVAYLLGPGPAVPTPPLLTTDDIFNYYLIDPEMCPCALMTRLLQASLAIQQFVQQCFLDLFFSSVKVDMSNSLWSEWSWRQQYRLWQANREVFLYPENYVLPQLRTNASPFFKDLENDLRQSNCDGDSAEAALENYLRKLVGVARLHVAAHYNETRPDGSTVLHVFAHTRGTPPQWYYRTRTGMAPGTGSWNAWQPLNLDIASQHVVPVIWDRHLHLIWPIFKQISEKQGDQSVPASGGGTPQSAPPKFWTVEFAMSELSAGHWQAKRTIEQKVFLNTEDSPLAFTFRASQDHSFNLQLQIYWVAIEEAIAAAMTQARVSENVQLMTGSLGSIFGGGGSYQSQTFTVAVYSSTATVQLSWNGMTPSITITASSGTSALITEGTLPMPESLLSVLEMNGVPPSSQSVDLSQEPTFALIASGTMSGQLATPIQYGFSGQDLVYGNYTLTNPGQQPLNVLCLTTSNGQPTSIKLLGTITNPRIVVPSQEPVFDSADPFFVADPKRTYLVQPLYYTISSRPQELTNLKYLSQWSTSYVFETFYHPYARTFLRELEIGGVPQLMARNLQVNPQAVRSWTPNFDFKALYNPQRPVATPYPGTLDAPDPGETALDFAAGSSGAYSLYNWEVFYHVPMFMASLLMQNQKYQDAMTWLQYIFNPSDPSGGPSPQRFWQMAPLNAMNASDWITQEIQNLLTTLAAETQQGINDAATNAAIQNWLQDPFDPHAVASLRISAYGKATIMKLLDVLIAWGDRYYSQYTAEKVSQAEQLYILADMILGPQPQVLRLPNAEQGRAGTATYASLKNLDAFSNVLVNIENVVVAPEPPMSVVQGTAQTPSLPQFPSSGNTLLFCIPPNDQLLAYWGKVAQRLYNIRHCLNLQGIPQPLPLYAPRINPLALIEAEAGGAGFSSTTPAAPIYRFGTYLQKALDLTNDVRAYGALILSALEKQDAETLAVLRANQELDIQTRMLDVKTMQVQEAQDQLTALQNQKAVVKIRYNFYSAVAFMNQWETAAITLQGAALIANGVAIILDTTSGGAHLVPSFSVGVSGFGGTPTVTASYGGENVASAASSWASVTRGLGGLLTEAGGMAATIGGYQRRMDEWTLQAQLANAELAQMDSQIAAATDRFKTATSELSIQNEQISNAQAVSDFFTSKYTNAQLYNWMVAQLTTVYAQAYQLAFSLALQAQNAYQYELGSSDTFIQFGYWDSQQKGLTAGESLLFDLRRMEAQYVAGNSRELELTKHISLALTSPMALVMLRETGTCQIALDEVLFESDHPGQYFRRLRSVALTIPCVAGPYTGVNATLSLTNAIVRIQAPGSAYKPQNATAAPNDPTVVSSPIAATGTATIATSSGQNDAGLFDVNLRDERWLPFEGQGVISTWNLVLDPRDNNFDFSTITDVVLHVRYTARGGADQTAANNVRAALKPPTSRSILVSVRNTFSNAYYNFFNPADTTATQQALTLPMTNILFPFSNLGNGIVKIESMAYHFVLSVPAAGNNIGATFGIGGGAPKSLALSPAAGQTTDGNPIDALTGSPSVSAPVTVPQSFIVTVPAASVPAALATTVNGQTRLAADKIEDILLIINYSIS